ncbi:hypothetical protein [Providencia phage Kokobel2]|nr:hypothetical protein [Providencia phage Kokobel2]
MSTFSKINLNTKSNTLNTDEEFLAQIDLVVETIQRDGFLVDIGFEYQVVVPHRSIRVNTTEGLVMYYPMRGRWQHKAFTWEGSLEDFIEWMTTFIKTGKYKGEPVSRPHAWNGRDDK